MLDPCSASFPDNHGPAVAARRKRRFAQALVAAPGIAFIAISLHGSFADYRHLQDVRRHAEARTAVGEARIIEAHDLAHGTVRTAQGAGTFGFTVASGREVRVPYRGFSGSPGTKLPVRYDPHDPENCAFGEKLFGVSDLLLSNAPFFAIGVYFLVLAAILGRRSA